jgi:cytochrome c-type biogenesis protein CcmH
MSMRASLRHLVLVLIVALAPTLAFAVEPGEMLKDPQLEARARSLSAELRCLVCQNESIDESQATLAHDLRVLIRQRIVAGESNQQIKSYLVSRYGNFILLKPPVETSTLLLWGTPIVILLCGGAGILMSMRRRAPVPKAAALSAAEEERLAALVADKES